MMQQTLRREVSVSGHGLFTGCRVSMRLCPADADSGIVFVRIDLPEKPRIPAQLEYVGDTSRCTRLHSGAAVIGMVEHLLSAFSARGIDNACVELDGPEVPCGDGSAKLFMDLLDEAGCVEQACPRAFLRPLQPVYFSSGESHLVALPSDEFRISYTLHYPRSSFVQSQYYSFLFHSDSYREEIAPCRTFSFYEEIAPLVEQGVIKGGGLENAVIIRNEMVANPGGLRFPNEMVRHKILDLIGDLALLGHPLKAHFIAIRSGHTANVAFAKMLDSQLEEGNP